MEDYRPKLIEKLGQEFGWKYLGTCMNGSMQYKGTFPTNDKGSYSLFIEVQVSNNIPKLIYTIVFNPYQTTLYEFKDWQVPEGVTPKDIDDLIADISSYEPEFKTGPVYLHISMRPVDAKNITSDNWKEYIDQMTFHGFLKP